MHLLPIFVTVFSSICASVIIPDQDVLGLDPFEAIKESLKKAGIIDGIVDDFTPECFVAPSYGDLDIEYGTHIKPSQAQDKPALQIICPELQQTPGMTLVLTDPDAPSKDNPKWGEYCHWIAIVPTSNSKTLTLKPADLEELVEYKPPGPPKKTGYHRYIFLLLEGVNSNLTKPEDRQHWGFGKQGHGVRDWAKKENLEVIGANFFFSKHKKQSR